MAPQCAPVMVPTPPGSRSPYSNNQAAVAGLLRHKYREMQQARAMQEQAASSSSTSASPPPGCPMHAGGAMAAPSAASSSPSSSGGINPANNMPFNLSLPSSDSSSGSGSRVKLSKERTISSIPRGEASPAPGASPYDPPAAPPSACPVAHKPKSESDAAAAAAPSRWEYPSPEQFQAALARKNKAAPDKHVEMMVLVHNFMNEEAWKLVLDWEKEFGVDTDKVALLRFTGRPGELSPRARWYGLLGSVMPSRYNATPPFDRHDWIVSRPDGTTARYVIDYYGDDEADAADERRRIERERARAQGVKVEDDDDDDQARFVLDVRPALDSFAALRVRAARTFREYQGTQTAAAAASSE